MALTNILAVVEGLRWSTPFGDPVVELDCPSCGRRLADVADLGEDLALVDMAEFRRGHPRAETRPQQVYVKAGLRAADRVLYAGSVTLNELWRFECRCGAKPVANAERLLAKVKEAISRGEHHLRLD
jgi:hypothetical protein